MKERKARRETPEAADLDEPAQEGGTIPTDPAAGERRVDAKGDVATRAQPPASSIRREPDPGSVVPTAVRRKDRQ